MSLSSAASSQVSVTQPIVLEPTLVERIWGVKNLQPWHAASVDGGPIGEIWLTAEGCKIQSGPGTGHTLAELAAQAPASLGDPQGEGFPLLIKLLFPREKLSVQVHPNDTQARALGMPRGKTECWYVLSAEPGAQVAAGFREPLSNDEMRAAIEDGTIEGKLRMIPVRAGDLVFVDAGTVHAIGPGMVVLETQQYSDTTYRLWDYGRPRELHVKEGTAVTRTETAAGLVKPQRMNGFTRLVACDFFAVDRYDLDAVTPAALGFEGKLQILIALDEGCTLEAQNGGKLPLLRAQAVILPVHSGAHRLNAASSTQVIRILQP